MRFFTCLLDLEGHSLSDLVRRAYESLPRSRGLPFHWQSANQVAVLTAGDDPHADPLVAEQGNHVAVGIVRLDNREDLKRWAECSGSELTDLEVVLRVVARHGTRYIPQFLGDFTFVMWNSGARTAVAACDSFGARRLYYTERSGVFAFASRAEALAVDERYEVQYLIELISLQGPRPDISVYAGVRSVPPASMAVLDRGRLTVHEYWNATNFEVQPAWAKSEGEAVETCRQLLAESVCLRVGGRGTTWAQLSGGLDSSSIVSLVSWLAERGEIAHGLAGTVTFVDKQGTGADEREYSDTVVKRWHVRNETIVDSPTWYDERYPPPLTDQPRFDLFLSPRDRRLCALIKATGGQVLLTGWGGDELLMGNMFFFADWVIQGRVWPAVREMAHRAAIGRVSFWELAYWNVVLPLLPQALQERVIRDQTPFQPWLERATMQRYGVRMRTPMAPHYAGPLGRKYRHAVAMKIGGLIKVTHPGVIAESLNVRHPFLYRPLVEFALRLPPDLRARPHAHRWVLREAMRGILPEQVRTRVGKPDTGGAVAWSLATERARLASLLREPMLADLGVLNANTLRAEFDAALHRTRLSEYVHTHLVSTLAVEAWLQMRSGRWPRGGHLGSAESTEPVAQAH